MSKKQYGKSEISISKFSTIDMQIVLNDKRTLKIENARLRAYAERLEKALKSIREWKTDFWQTVIGQEISKEIKWALAETEEL